MMQQQFPHDFSTTKKPINPNPPSLVFPKNDKSNFPDDYENDDDDDDGEGSQRSPRLKNKIRQHANPLSRNHQQPLLLPENFLEKIFLYPRNPLILDIGCAKGGWVLDYAIQHPDENVIGLELRESAVEICEARRKRFGIKNAFFYKSNANVDLANILTSIQQYNLTGFLSATVKTVPDPRTKADSESTVATTTASTTTHTDPSNIAEPSNTKFAVKQSIPSLSNQPFLQMITIQFPDPHFKKRHQKRRVVNAEFVSTLAKLTDFNHTLIFLQTDIRELMEDMTSYFNQSPYFSPVPPYSIDSYEKNPNPSQLPTEREIACESKGTEIYRMLYQRNAVEFVLEENK